VRQHRARHPDRAEDIRLEQSASLLDRALLRRAGNADARIVDQDLDAARSVKHVPDGSSHRLIVGDIEREENHSVSRLPGAGSPAGAVHGEPGTEERTRGRLTDPRRCARDKRYPICVDCHDHSFALCITIIIL
jgi:hypothetical protein